MPKSKCQINVRAPSNVIPAKAGIQVFLIPKLSYFFTLHKGGGEAEKPFRAITFDGLNQPWG
jgi:hypothetical protein